MNLCNWILTKLAIVMVLFCVVAAIDVPSNPVRYLFRSFCHSVHRYSGDGSSHSR